MIDRSVFALAVIAAALFLGSVWVAVKMSGWRNL
jgi:hypothetical protein